MVTAKLTTGWRPVLPQLAQSGLLGSLTEFVGRLGMG